jgi:ABC-type transport system involved in multi-copper enzyme maturation permease subunit
VATHILLFGVELQADAARRPDVAAPYLFLVFVVQLLVRHLACLVGIVLGLFATFDAVSSALEPGVADLLLSRPIARFEAVLGRFLGALAFGLVQLLWTVGLVTLLGGLKLGLWVPMAVAFVPPVMLKFAVLLSLATLVAVATRTAALGLAAACAVWLGSTAIYYLQSSGVAPSLALEWVAHLAPPVSHLDDVASIAAGIPVEVAGADLHETIAAAIVWTVAPLLLTAFIVRRRDY